MNVPQLRFSGFEDTWSKKKIKEIALVTSGLTPLRSRNEFFRNGSIPWVKTMDLNNSIIKDTQEYVTEVAMKETSLRLLPANTLLIAMYGGFNQIGRTGIISFTGTTNQAISALTPKENSFSPFFLQSYLNFNVEKWKRLAASSRKDPNITKSDIENFFVRLPSIAEQEKLASFFKLIEQRIEKQQEKIEKLVQFKKGMMQKIFSQEVRFKGEDGGEYPEWETKQLKEFATKTVKKNKDMKVTNVISNSAKQGLISQRSYFKKDIANELNIDGYYVISKGDFVYNPRISSESPYGPVHVYELEDDGIVSPLYLCFKTKDIDSKFLKYFFISSRWYKHIYTHGDSGARHDRVSIKDSSFFEMNIAMPSLAEQEKISDYLTSLNLKVEKEKEKLLVLEEQKKGFMRGMFV